MRSTGGDKEERKRFFFVRIKKGSFEREKREEKREEKKRREKKKRKRKEKEKRKERDTKLFAREKAIQMSL